jgi:uncharacterized protein
MKHGFFFWVLVKCNSVFVGLGKGGLLVIAGLAIPTFSLVMPPIVAVSMLLIVYIVSDIFALLVYRRDYDNLVLLIALIGMIIGVLIGWLTVQIVIEWVLPIFISLMGALFARRMVFNPSKGRVGRYPINKDKGYF